MKLVNWSLSTTRACKRSGIGAENGAERAENWVSGSRAVSGCKETGWSGSRAGAGGRGAANGSHRNRFERRVEILPLPLRSHALSTTARKHCFWTLIYCILQCLDHVTSALVRDARPHLCSFGAPKPWLVQKQFGACHIQWGRSKPRCWIIIGFVMNHCWPM